jgi:hypothetical protein
MIQLRHTHNAKQCKNSGGGGKRAAAAAAHRAAALLHASTHPLLLRGPQLEAVLVLLVDNVCFHH